MHYGLFKNGEYNFVYSSMEDPMISVSIHCFQVVVILPWLMLLSNLTQFSREADEKI